MLNGMQSVIIATLTIRSLFFKRLFMEVIDKHAPLRVFHSPQAPKPWMSPNIEMYINNRNAAYNKWSKTKNLGDLEYYRAIRNRTKQVIRNAKIVYAHSLFNNVNSSKEMWKNLKKLKVVNKPKSNTSGPDPDALNAHYAKSEVLDGNLVQSKIDFYEAQPKLVTDDNKFYFKNVGPEAVWKTINSIGSNAKGIDGITVQMLKYCLCEITPVLLHICNYSLQHCTFPQLWKIAVVKPIPKVINPKIPKDYRPISLLSVLSKVLEKIVHDQVIQYLETSSLLNPSQSGFKKGHSTDSALLKVSGDLRKAMDNRLLSILVLYDFSNAFPSVHHDLLLSKLRWMGFSETSVAWFKAYLTGRLQKVLFNDLESCLLPILLGVPQGSIHGFILITLILCSNIQKVTCMLTIFRTIYLFNLGCLTSALIY